MYRNPIISAGLQNNKAITPARCSPSCHEFSPLHEDQQGLCAAPCDASPCKCSRGGTAHVRRCQAPCAPATPSNHKQPPLRRGRYALQPWHSLASLAMLGWSAFFLRQRRLTMKYLFHIKKYQLAFLSNSICQMPFAAKPRILPQPNTQLIPTGSRNSRGCTQDHLQQASPPASINGCRDGEGKLWNK